MTIPAERTRAVVLTESFLLSLCDPKQTPRVPRSVRERARGLLRHYPNEYYMDVIAAREDGDDTSLIKVQVFGNGL